MKHSHYSVLRETQIAERLLNRDEVVELIRREFGIPLTKYAFKIGKRGLAKSASSPLAPPLPVAHYGRLLLYSADDARAWARRIVAHNRAENLRKLAGRPKDAVS